MSYKELKVGIQKQDSGQVTLFYIWWSRKTSLKRWPLCLKDEPVMWRAEAMCRWERVWWCQGTERGWCIERKYEMRWDCRKQLWRPWPRVWFYPKGNKKLLKDCKKGSNVISILNSVTYIGCLVLYSLVPFSLYLLCYPWVSMHLYLPWVMDA